jgi:hypothetical protein
MTYFLESALNPTLPCAIKATFINCGSFKNILSRGKFVSCRKGAKKEHP